MVVVPDNSGSERVIPPQQPMQLETGGGRVQVPLVTPGDAVHVVLDDEPSVLRPVGLGPLTGPGVHRAHDLDRLDHIGAVQRQPPEPAQIVEERRLHDDRCVVGEPGSVEPGQLDVLVLGSFLQRSPVEETPLPDFALPDPQRVVAGGVTVDDQITRPVIVVPHHERPVPGLSQQRRRLCRDVDLVGLLLGSAPGVDPDGPDTLR